MWLVLIPGSIQYCDNVEQAMFYTVKTYDFLYLADKPSVDKTLPGSFSPGSTKNDTCQK